MVAGLSVSWVSDQVGRPDLMHTLAGLLAWTPFGLAWAAPADVAAGAPGTGLLRLLLAVLVLGALLALWDRLLRRGPGEPPLGQRPWRRAAGRGRMVRPDARHAHRGRRGPLGDVLAPRPALPAVGGHDAAAAARAAGPGGRWQRRLAARDGAADGLPARLGDAQRPGLRRHGVLAARQHRCRRRADRVGRLVPTAALGLVLVPGYAVLSSALTGRWQMLPADLGAGLGLLLAGFGIASVVSVLAPYPVPASGDSPFATPPGATGVTLLRAAGVRGRRRHPQRPRAGAVAGRPGRVRLAGVGLPARGAGARRGRASSSACGRARGSTSGGRRTCCRTWPGSASRGRGRRPARPRR